VNSNKWILDFTENLLITGREPKLVINYLSNLLYKVNIFEKPLSKKDNYSVSNNLSKEKSSEFFNLTNEVKPCPNIHIKKKCRKLKRKKKVKHHKSKSSIDKDFTYDDSNVYNPDDILPKRREAVTKLNISSQYLKSMIDTLRKARRNKGVEDCKTRLREHYKSV